MQTTTAARVTRLFKRYQNRKFYDPLESRYVNFDEIARVICGGATVRVVDSGTKRDVTGATLARILSREEKGASAETLFDLIRAAAATRAEASPGTPGPAALPENDAPPAQGDLEVRPDAADRIVRALLSRGHRVAFGARAISASYLAALERLDETARERIAAASDLVAAVERLKRQLGRAGRRIERLWEELRALETR